MSLISIKYRINEVIVEPDSGQLIQWNHNGAGVFYQGSSIRRSGIPILFPFANPLKDYIFEITGKKIPQHGFGRDFAWQVTDHTHNSLTMTLTQDDISSAMKEAYLYEFEVNILISVSENILCYALRVTNKSSQDMPIAPGIHPYFPIAHKDKSKVKIGNLADFKNDIDWEADNNGFFYDFGGTANIYFPSGRQIEIKSNPTDSFNHIVLWSQSAKNIDHDFVCIEPFTRQTNAINDNPILIKPSESWQSEICFTIKK